jgi:hypothetical protein
MLTCKDKALIDYLAKNLEIEASVHYDHTDTLKVSLKLGDIKISESECTLNFENN